MDDRVTYRSDIDGLRCISVLSVMAFHYGSWRISGGYVGVDIFFVISGYLITSQIYKDFEAGRFSVLRFYDRRMRRILPAMLLIVALSLIAGYVLLIPQDYVRLAESATASTVGLANIYFLMHSGYFDPARDSLPLLHLWSLGVEEQYYLIWPLAFVAIARWSGTSKKAIILALSIVILISFAASVWIVQYDQPQAFYMLHTRAWELALGALLVFLPAVTSPALATIAGLVGLAAISFSILTLSAASLFPGLNAFMPCLGAALIVAPKTRTDIAARILSLPPLVFLGKISYSLYLWHWPLFVFLKIHNIGKMPTHREAIAIASVALALSVLSYFYVEKPFRKLRPIPARTVASGLAAICAVFFISYGVEAAQGFPDRFAPDVMRFYGYMPRPMIPTRYDACFLSSKDRNDISRFSPNDCLQISSSKPNVVIIGDSHAAQFAEAMRHESPDISFSQVTASGCTPVVPFSGAPRCSRLMARAFEEFLQKYAFDDVILSAEWSDDTINKIRATIEAIPDKTRHITVLGPSIEYLAPMPLLLGKANELHDPSLIGDRSDRETASRVSNGMRRALEKTRAQYLSVVDAECEGGSCPGATNDGVPMLFDRDHFTFEGATVVLRRLKNRGLFSWRYSSQFLTSQSRAPR